MGNTFSVGRLHLRDWSIVEDEDEVEVHCKEEKLGVTCSQLRLLPFTLSPFFSFSYYS